MRVITTVYFVGTVGPTVIPERNTVEEGITREEVERRIQRNLREITDYYIHKHSKPPVLYLCNETLRIDVSRTNAIGMHIED